MAVTDEVRDMRDAETTLAIIRERGKRGLPLERVYRQLFNQDLYLRAYGRLYRNAGAMTKGTTSETVDGMSRRKVEEIIESVRHERFRWTPVRRTYILKGNGKLRPLGIPPWRDKLLQEVMRSILEAYYEPQFSPTSHGFRAERGCHTALRDIFCSWTGTKWFIEGDIKGCFDNIDHPILMSILREKIHDGRFLTLVENLLRAGYLEQWDFRPTLSGTPQGGVASPLLANIYLDKLDKFVERTLIPEYTKGVHRRRKPEYSKICDRITWLKRRGADEATLKPLRDRARVIGSTDQFDPDYRRLRYIRYADDFLLGLVGPRDEAEEIKTRLADFLHEDLRLEMSPEKTLITHAGTEFARFLGYEIGTKSRKHGGDGYHIKLRLPLQKLAAKIARYTQKGKPIHRTELLNETDFSIVSLYGSEYRGIVEYYALAENRSWLWRLHWVMEASLLKTLPAKHKTSVRKVSRSLRAETCHRGRYLKCLEVKQLRPDKEPLVARFGGLRLKPDVTLMIEDGPTDRDRWHPRNELIARLLADVCEICGSKENVQVHHVRKLADLKVPGRREKPRWMKIMAARKRKTLVVCASCHSAIHNGQPTRKPMGDAVIKE
jgi:group II intron reverse transcriptase/maturase